MFSIYNKTHRDFNPRRICNQSEDFATRFYQSSFLLSLSLQHREELLFVNTVRQQLYWYSLNEVDVRPSSETVLQTVDNDSTSIPMLRSC